VPPRFHMGVRFREVGEAERAALETYLTVVSKREATAS